MPARRLLLLGPGERCYGEVPPPGPAPCFGGRARRVPAAPLLLRIVLLLLLLAGVRSPVPAAAQAHSPRFTHLTAGDGLSNNRVFGIVQDRRGTMWFGTPDGLNRYDGYTITTYRHRRSDPQSLSDNTVYALYEDRAGTLWVGTTVGLDSLAGADGRFRHHAAIAEEVRAIWEDTAGLLWVGTSGAGLWSYDRATGAFAQYLPDPADPHSLGAADITRTCRPDAPAFRRGEEGRLVLPRPAVRFPRPAMRSIGGRGKT